MIQGTVKFKININNRAFRSIEKRLVKSTRRAIEYYANRVKNALMPIRSKPVGGNLKKRVPPYSKPGQYPHSQTLELYKSVKYNCKEVAPGIIRAECGTDVSYAPALELGGLTNFEPNRKHSKFWLVNFIKKPIFIMARPLWLPIFVRELKIMVITIARI